MTTYYTYAFDLPRKTHEQISVYDPISVAVWRGYLRDMRNESIHIMASSRTHSPASRRALHSCLMGAWRELKSSRTSHEKFLIKSRGGANTPAPPARCGRPPANIHHVKERTWRAVDA